jgi:hypothetical protein
MSEKQKQNLAKARVAARAKRAELKALRDKEKALKKDDLLIKKLMVEKKVLEHKKMIKNLAVDAGYYSESERPKPKRKPYTHKNIKEDDDEEDKYKKSEIEELKEQLKALKKKHKIITPDNSEAESETESEVEHEVIKKSHSKPIIKPKRVIEEKEKRLKPKKPIIEKDPDLPPVSSRKKNPNPMKNYEEDDDNPQIKAALNSLFA